MSKAQDDFMKPSTARASIRKSNDQDDFHGKIVPDPFRWLENLEDDDVKVWAENEASRTSAFLAENKSLEDLKSKIEDALTYEKESLPVKHGNHYFLTYTDGEMEQDVLVRRETPLGASEIILDPNSLSENGTSSLQSYSINEDGSLIAYAISEGGTDLSTIYIKDLRTGELLADKIEQARWPDFIWNGSEGFYYQIPCFDETKRRMVKYHAIGDDTSNDKDIFLHEKDGTIADPYDFPGSDNIWVNVAEGTEEDNGVWLVDKMHRQEPKEIVSEGVAQFHVVGEFGNHAFIETSLDADRKRILKLDINHPNIADAVEIVGEHESDVIDRSFVHKDKLYISYLSDCANRVEVRDLDGHKICDVPVPERSLVEFGSIDPDSDDIYFMLSNDLSGAKSYYIDSFTGDVHLHRVSQCPVNLEGCIVERLFATSRDGTKVPMTVVRRADVMLDGSAATCLYGYGGFNVPILPSFSLTKWSWVQAGGIYVDTNLRGGGEFGSDWYEQGKKHNKQNVFDDFIACAEYLVAHNYTSSDRLMSNGGSNGGLLTLATMIQRPDLFGSVISDVPVADMLRFMIPTFGAYWISDYGDPVNNAEDFAVSMAYSPLHNVEPGADYPPCLIKTAHGDDRVVPWHSYKMAATLFDKSPNSPVYLKVDMDKGHGAGTSKSQDAQELAQNIAWAELTMGPLDPEAYKLSLKSALDKGNDLAIS